MPHCKRRTAKKPERCIHTYSEEHDGQCRASPYEGGGPPTCVGFVEAEFPLARPARRWQYIHLPRGPEPRGVHLENRIPRGRTRGRAPSPTEDRLRTIIYLSARRNRIVRGASEPPHRGGPSTRTRRERTLDGSDRRRQRACGRLAGRASADQTYEVWTESSILAQDERWRRA